MDLSQYSDEELLKIAGEEKKLSPRRKEVEEKIAQRPDPLDILKQKIAQQQQPIQSLLNPLSAVSMGGAVLDVPMGRLESIFASAGLGLQEGQPAQEIMSDVWKSITGERQAELGDIIRTTGFAGKATEPIAALTGLLGMAGVLKATTALGKLTSRKLPKIMGSRWITQQARNAQRVAKNLEQSLGNAFRNVRGPVAQIPVNPADMDDILLNSDIDDVVLKEIDRLVGKVDTVEKAYTVVDILRKKAGTAVYRAGGATGKGGMANIKIRLKSVIPQIKKVIHETVGGVDKEAANKLMALDNYAATKVYPKIDKIYRMVGRGVEPSTEGIASTYALTGGFRGVSPGLGKAAQREIIREIPKTAKGLSQYMGLNYKRDLANLLRSSKQLAKDMGKYRLRQLLKIGAGLYATAQGYQFLRRMGPQTGEYTGY
jgi:hypothetical protein